MPIMGPSPIRDVYVVYIISVTGKVNGVNIYLKGAGPPRASHRESVSPLSLPSSRAAASRITCPSPTTAVKVDLVQSGRCGPNSLFIEEEHIGAAGAASRFMVRQAAIT
jgi:hypothetical protein